VLFFAVGSHFHVSVAFGNQPCRQAPGDILHHAARQTVEPNTIYFAFARRLLDANFHWRLMLEQIGCPKSLRSVTCSTVSRARARFRVNC
jgi:hypothetical protein